VRRRSQLGELSREPLRELEGALRDTHCEVRHRARRGKYRIRWHRGFTLVEIMVAIAIGGMVMLGARALLEALADEEHRMAGETAVQDARANGERTLRALVGRLEVGTSEGGPFTGVPAATSCTSWCDVPSGWQERCEVAIAFEIEGDAPVLVARLAGGRRLVLERGFHSGTLRYLNSAGAGGQWFQKWGTGITAPLALGVILDSDTLIVRIGERG
jgi:prepilin-type N-terminal cleavage/methylation domain-containing protein